MVATSSNIPFPVAGNPNPAATGTNISVSSAGVIQIAATGWYQMTWGFMSTTGAGRFEVLVNTGSGFVALPFGPNTGQIDFSAATNTRVMQSETVLIHATANPTTIVIQNIGTASVVLNNGVELSTGGPVAYATIIKISN